MANDLITNSDATVPSPVLTDRQLIKIGEVATTRDGRDITRPYYIQNQIVPNRDPILNARGGDLRLYDDVFMDGQVKSTFQQRQRAIISKELVVEAGGKRARDREAASWLEGQLKALRFDRVTERMAYGLFYGFAVAELIYEPQGAMIGLSALRVRKQRRFGFDGDGRLLLKTMQKPLGEVMPDRKFWVFSCGTDHDDEPYGLGLGAWCYWPVFFKRQGLTAWSIFLEKFASPTAVGTFPANTSPADVTKLLNALAAIQMDSGIAIPEGMKVELLAAARSGTADYETMHRLMDEIITKIILSQTMTTEAGSSYSQSKTHQNTKDDIVKADADLLHESFNSGPVQWLIDLNFAGAAYPRVFRRTDADKDLEATANFFVKLDEIGVEADQELITATFGQGFTKVARPLPNGLGGAQPGAQPGTPALVPGSGSLASGANGDPANDPGNGQAEFAQGPAPVGVDLPRDGVDDLVDQTDVLAGPAFDQMINDLKAVVMQAKSLPDLADKLLAVYAGLKPDQLGEVMAQAMTVAQLQGRDDLIAGI